MIAHKSRKRDSASCLLRTTASVTSLLCFVVLNHSQIIYETSELCCLLSYRVSSLVHVGGLLKL